MRNAWGLARLRVVSFRRNGRNVTRQTQVIGAPLVRGGHRTNLAVETVTNLTIWIAADGMRNLGGRRVRVGWRFDRRLQNLGERGRVESGKFPFRAVTRAVGTERSIVAAACVARIVALLACRVKLGAML